MFVVGVQFVMIGGMVGMLRLFVDNLATDQMVSTIIIINLPKINILSLLD